MDRLDKIIKENIEKQTTSEKYNKMIKDTMKMISNNEIQREEKAKVVKKLSKGQKLLKIMQPIAAVFVMGILGATTYATITGRLNLGKIGLKKVEENYDESAVVVEKQIENEYCKITLESMAADPAYLIYEYYIDFTDEAMEKMGGEVPEDELNGYEITLLNTLEINGKKIEQTAGWTFIDKLAEKQYRMVYVYNIANINENILEATQKLEKLYVGEGFKYLLETEINQDITTKITFKENEKKILAKNQLQNGSTLYIEEVAKSKFENYVLARIVTDTKTYKEMDRFNEEFMIEDPQFAICDENGKNINYDYKRLEEYYEKVTSDGKILKTYDRTETPEDTDLVRMEQVQLLRLGIDEENEPQKLKILPLNRKLYNDRNDSEEKFYKNENWYQVKAGEVNISEESQIGGKVTITKIEETDDEIIFYYDKEGLVQSDIDLVLRIKSSKMNYVYPIKTELKNIDGEENKIVLAKDMTRSVGMPLISEYDELPSIEKLEFAMFYNTKYDVLSEALEFDWDSKGSEQTGTIEVE